MNQQSLPGEMGGLKLYVSNWRSAYPDAVINSHPDEGVQVHVTHPSAGELVMCWYCIERKVQAHAFRQIPFSSTRTRMQWYACVKLSELYLTKSTQSPALARARAQGNCGKWTNALVLPNETFITDFMNSTRRQHASASALLVLFISRALAIRSVKCLWLI